MGITVEERVAALVCSKQNRICLQKTTNHLASRALMAPKVDDALDEQLRHWLLLQYGGRSLILTLSSGVSWMLHQAPTVEMCRSRTRRSCLRSRRAADGLLADRYPFMCGAPFDIYIYMPVLVVESKTRRDPLRRPHRARIADRRILYQIEAGIGPSSARSLINQHSTCDCEFEK